jgi:formate C-acetyltransferase
MPKGGWRVVESSLKAYGFEPDPQISKVFTEYCKTHNDGVFAAYTPEIRRCRSSSGIITGLPDAYGRGRIIGDYHRPALYGVDFLVQEKQRERAELDHMHATEEVIRLREELADQLKSLRQMTDMAQRYGYDISQPAATGREGVQWTYFAYLAAIKEQNGAAMSVGRISTFLDIYLERGLREGELTEAQAQELIDSSCGRG